MQNLLTARHTCDDPRDDEHAFVELPDSPICGVCSLDIDAPVHDVFITTHVMGGVPLDVYDVDADVRRCEAILGDLLPEDARRDELDELDLDEPIPFALTAKAERALADAPSGVLPKGRR